MTENSSRSNAFQRAAGLVKGGRQSTVNSLPSRCTEALVGADVLTRRYTGTGIMLCPDELVAFSHKQSGTAKVFRLCMTKGFFIF